MSANNRHLLDRKDVWANGIAEVKASRASKLASAGKPVDLLTPEQTELERLRQRRVELTEQMRSVELSLTGMKKGFQDEVRRSNLIARKSKITGELQDVNSKLHIINSKETPPVVDIALQILTEIRELRAAIAAFGKKVRP